MFVNKIGVAFQGKITSQLVMPDVGTTTYSAFIYDEKNKRYKQVILKTDGGLSTVNNAPEATEIYNWMQKINN